MPAVDYRSLQAPEQVDTNLPDSGAGRRAEALRQTFKEFEGISADVYTQAQLHAGALAGAAAGATGHPEYREGLARLTAYGRAFNNAATGAYAVQAQAQVDDTAARLRIEANNDPEHFRTTFTAARDAALKQAPADAVPMLTELWGRHLAAGIQALRGDQLVEQRNLQRKTYDEGIERQTSKVAMLQGDPLKQLEAMDEQTKLSLMIDGGVNSGLYSKAEAESLHINTAREITAQVFETHVDAELNNPNGDVVGLLERFRQSHLDNLNNPNAPTIFSEKEFQDLMAKATTKVREWNLTQALMKREGKTEEQLRWENGDKKFTELLLRQQLSEKMLADAVRTGDLKPERASSLRAALITDASGGPSKSNAGDLARMLHDPNFLDLTGDDIQRYPGQISQQDRLAAVRDQQRRLDTWENTQRYKDGVRDIDDALKIPPGTPSYALSPAQRKQRDDAVAAYRHDMEAADPAKRDMLAPSLSQKAIHNIKVQQATDELSQAQQNRANFIATYGPGGKTPKDKDSFERRLKQYDDAISQQQAALKKGL